MPENFNDDNFTPDSTNCIVNILCERHGAIAVEAIGIKEYSLKRYITKLFNERILRGDVSNFSGILEPVNFDANSKAINKAYAQHVLSVGDLDERIFLGKKFVYFFVWILYFTIGFQPQNFVSEKTSVLFNMHIELDIANF